MRRIAPWKPILIGLVLIASVWSLLPTVRYYALSPDDRSAMDPAALERLEGRLIRLGLDLKGGMHLVLEVDLSEVPREEHRDAVNGVLDVIKSRVDQFGVSEPVVQEEGEDRIIVELPGLEDIGRARKLIGERAQLKFQMLRDSEDLRSVLDKLDRVYAERGDLTPAPRTGIFGEEIAEDSLRYVHPFTQYLTALGSDIAVSVGDKPTVDRMLNDPDALKAIGSTSEFLWARRAEGEFYPLYFIKSRPEMRGDAVAEAKIERGSDFDPQTAGQPIINFTVKDEAARLFSRVTGDNVGKRLAIVLDDVVYSAPVIQTKIRDGRSIITGSRTIEEAKDLAIAIRTGALPAPVDIIEERTIGPSLGADSIRQGVRAAIVGVLIVTLVMVAYYRLCGLVANLALVLNLTFVMAIMGGLGFTLTLPGIAGIILTIGMAVDANVLIFERIREELRGGKTIRAAIDSGFSRAIGTILDANVTTVIAAIVLYQFGTGPIKGFAVTLFWGIVSSFFTAVFITRLILDVMTLKPNVHSLSIGQSGLFIGAGFPFINWRRPAIVISSAVILVGLVFVGARGLNYSIDFVGGTLIEYRFDPPVTVGDVRQALSSVPLDGGTMDLSGSEIKRIGAGGGGILVRVGDVGHGSTTSDAISAQLKEAFTSHIPVPERDWVLRLEKVGPKIGGELKADAFKAIIVSLLAIILYVWWRFLRVEFGLAAVAALFHDVLITVGVFAVLYHEVSLAVVAALLTIVGYSLNDTIVVFDRIRENQRTMRREPYNSILNHSINECLSRTAITSLTTLIVVVALLTFGGDVIRTFALALLIGVFVGTYSSIFIASPLVYLWYRRAEARQRIRQATRA